MTTPLYGGSGEDYFGQGLVTSQKGQTMNPFDAFDVPAFGQPSGPVNTYAPTQIPMPTLPTDNPLIAPIAALRSQAMDLASVVQPTAAHALYDHEGQTAAIGAVDKVIAAWKDVANAAYKVASTPAQGPLASLIQAAKPLAESYQIEALANQASWKSVRTALVKDKHDHPKASAVPTKPHLGPPPLPPAVSVPAPPNVLLAPPGAVIEPAAEGASWGLAAWIAGGAALVYAATRFLR
jgi:hypothetical protein